MAGDWIKMRIDLADDPAVIAIAATCGIDEDAVIGKLFRLWGWANRQTRDGNVTSVTQSWLDRFTRADGFATALEKVGWLVITGDGITFPNYGRHNSQTAKQRALTADRVRRHRALKGCVTSVTGALPEKRREEKSMEDESSIPPLARRSTETADSRPSVTLFPDIQDNPHPEATPKAVPVLTFPCQGKQPQWHLTEERLQAYRELYPGLDVLFEVKRALQWVLDCPKRRKTAQGMPRYLTNWLNRAADSVRPPHPATQRQHHESFDEKLKRAFGEEP